MVVVGVDVGGEKKGFHAVALRDGAYHRHEPSSRGGRATVDSILEWCRELDAQASGVDARCKWRQGENLRAAESQLKACRIECFPTPRAEAAEDHPTANYRWMINGQALFRRLRSHYPLFKGETPSPSEK